MVIYCLKGLLYEVVWYSGYFVLHTYVSMVGPLVQFPAGAIYFLKACMSPSASDILLFVINTVSDSKNQQKILKL